MLTGVKAFEACWSALKQTYPTSKTESNLLIQSMGQFVDRYATQEEIKAGLPQPLQALFDRLVEAYLHGYAAPPAPARPTTQARPPSHLTATTLALRQLRSQLPTLANEADTLVVDAPTRRS